MSFTNSDYVLAYLSENPDGEFTAKEIATTLDINEGTVGGALSTAHKQGLVARRKERGVFLYRHGKEEPEVVRTEEQRRTRRPAKRRTRHQLIADQWSVLFGQHWTPELVEVALRVAERTTHGR